MPIFHIEISTAAERCYKFTVNKIAGRRMTSWLPDVRPCFAPAKVATNLFTSQQNFYCLIMMIENPLSMSSLCGFIFGLPVPVVL